MLGRISKGLDNVDGLLDALSFADRGVVDSLVGRGLVGLERLVAQWRLGFLERVGVVLGAVEVDRRFGANLILPTNSFRSLDGCERLGGAL